jgi:preprotein translocase subunit SecG
MGIGGSAAGGGGNEYGSKKSIEGTLKKVATVSAILFVGLSLFLPFVD